MERDQATLTEAVGEYELAIGGVKFWTPYWANNDEPPYYLGAPYNGKGTPGQLRSALLRRLGQQRFKTGEDYRRAMRQAGLGIECSGFAYHVMSKLLASRGLRLADHVFAQKGEVIAASQRPRWQKAGVSQVKLNNLPEQISVTKLHQLFKVNPRRNVNVNRLTSAAAAITVPIDQARPGDMIKMSGFRIAHVGIIVEVTPKLIRYADSSREWGRYGGVRYVDIKLTNRGGLEQQEWVDRKYYFPEKGDRICRLKALDGSARGL